MPRFFGLEPEQYEQVILEPWFNLAYYCGITWETYMNWPVPIRDWTLRRILKEINNAGASKSPVDNPPDVKALTGQIRQIGSPSPKLHRFPPKA
jgi:hypothetical protein